ncbi:MAG: tetratricopeptide repeat protein [Alphaproteobacteria bacterium]|nr:tetratricopeptide repeat protein [Alphaproteobacteria bacterium]
MKKKQEYNQEDAFLREVEEDLKNESLKKLWDKYGLFVVIFVAAVLTLAVSYESIKSWYVRRAENWANAYSVALTLQNQGKYQESIDALNMIISKNFGAYAPLAKMQQVNVLLDSGKQDLALNKLNELIADKKYPSQLRDVAIIKLASFKQDEAPRDELEKILSPITSQPDNSWYATAQYMLAAVSLRDGNKEEAKDIYDGLLKNNNVSEEFKSKIKDILSVLKE